MKVMPFLVGFDLVVAPDIGAIDLHQSALERLAVLVFDIPFE
jgi:hypothetical protein